jgi:uncharacterized protein DUF3311
MGADTQDTLMGSRRAIYRFFKGLFLVLPFFGLLPPWIYNTDAPRLFGIPFFYWYQVAWIPLTMLLLLSIGIADSKRSDH